MGIIAGRIIKVGLSAVILAFFVGCFGPVKYVTHQLSSIRFLEEDWEVSITSFQKEIVEKGIFVTYSTLGAPYEINVKIYAKSRPEIRLTLTSLELIGNDDGRRIQLPVSSETLDFSPMTSEELQRYEGRLKGREISWAIAQYPDIDLPPQTYGVVLYLEHCDVGKCADVELVGETSVDTKESWSLLLFDRLMSV
ncbi:hypothetical protein [Aliiroseovarius crassostreae]|uniref:hypothetical protein n=1 Tax=Aliiroseovarius crassostreae TaxID=154981 RepID=UPI00220DB04C|nr:hypothetical protein [Aliiroseovarius crassostreae]UWP99359.1 hypothetical protein K3X53_04200 [Aliiroseovarius crassostreae]